MTKAARTRTAAMKAARDIILDRQGIRCVMPDCDELWSDAAHVEPSGLGGRPSTNVAENLVGLCRTCHDIFDGRRLQGRQHMLRVLMAALVETR